MNKKKGLLVVISGPSGVGKSSVVRALLRMSPYIKLSVSATTRKARPMEKDGKDYYFYSEKEFFNMVERGEFYEWAEVHKAYYGTPRKHVEKWLEKGESVILEIDVQGASKIKEAITKGIISFAGLVYVFLIPPSVDILAFRLKRRKTEKEDALNWRLRAAIAELQVMEKYDYIVVNDKIESAAEKINAIISVEKERMLYN
jgi:guanylate kinase